MGLAPAYQAVHKARWEREAVGSSGCVNPGRAAKNASRVWKLAEKITAAFVMKHCHFHGVLSSWSRRINVNI